jgi:hypothetical protein
MSVSKIIAELRAKEQTNVNEAKARFELVNKVLSAIPESSPSPVSVYNHGYCSDACINFNGEGIARILYELYPPMDCVDVQGNSQTQKPVKHLRLEELGAAIVPIFPIVFKSSKDEHRARWWTTMEGIVVEVNVINAHPDEFETELKSGRYTTDSHSYPTGSVLFFPRALASPAVRPSSMVAWMQAWTEFGVASSFNAEQQKFLAIIARYLVIAQETHVPDGQFSLKLDDLIFLQLPGYAQEGTLAGLFTEKEQQMVLNFGQTQADAVRAALHKQAEDFEAVQSWFTGFFAKFGHLYDNDYKTHAHIAHRLRKDTGLDVTIRTMRPSFGKVSVSPFFKGWDEYPDYVFPLSTDPQAPRVKPQDIEVDYQ